MRYRLLPALNLRLLILLLALTASLSTLVSGFYSTYQVQKEQLINYTLKSNYAYARKLASATDSFLEAAMQQVAYSAKIVEQQIEDDNLLKQEVIRLNLQTNSFNSVVINKGGIVVATSPELPELINQPISSTGALQAAKEKRPLISNPYMSVAGNLIIFISHPLFNTQGDYLGYIGGTLYLNEPNTLNNLLEQHYYRQGTYIYVIDANKRILYHPDPKYVGLYAGDNSIINSVIAGKAGTSETTNRQGEGMLAGFAPVTRAKWRIVAQRSVRATLTSLDLLIVEVIKRTLPQAIITFILIGFFAHFISRPLKQLADRVNTLDDPVSFEKLKNVKSWYFESQRLKLAMLKGVNILQMQIGQLRHDAETDPLTNTHNRRSLNGLLNQLMVKQTPFALLEIDIDFFKRVNDTFGHGVGDEALKSLTNIIKNLSRKDDIVARIGGEEFVLVLPNESSESALKIAERLRMTVESTNMKTIGFITISIGIATWPKHSNDIDQVYKCADKALYHAKEHGRNRCIVAQGD
ncbi:sensor domain-containing diguanylate cyclase [Pseudoalteromonas sp. SWXJZ94C]|uniref:sensor domain-containing diguanylate cyclase n=1 Tax=Pseudoalteromonas sp. SWXJZ94C TaxID=2792065 RepID=UPI0019814CA4|nr:sensor domain-containing diguanylate cyclase [Pseudoalteromonas sp. SWXJZ94C]